MDARTGENKARMILPDGENLAAEARLTATVPFPSRGAMSDRQRADEMHANIARTFEDPNLRARWNADSNKSTIKVEGLDGAVELAGGLLILAVVWGIMGIIAFLMSLYCFSKSGSTGGQNAIGLALAVFLGPLYWFYYAWGGSYCTSAKIAPL